jgi:glyoxylase-like metal-dependent hydrolase (beta-lactamase superfamily II)
MVEIQRVVVGPFQENCYILTVGDEDGIVIDPGDEAEKIMEAIGTCKISSILLTHAHVDHIGAVAAIQRQTGAAIGMSDREVPLLKGAATQAAIFGLPAPPPFKIDFFVQDNQLISLGESQVTAFATPGHSPGGVSYYVQGRLFAGDVLFYNSIGRTDLPAASSSQLLASIRNTLLILADETIVYPGHGPETTIGREKKYNPFF